MMASYWSNASADSFQNSWDEVINIARIRL